MTVELKKYKDKFKELAEKDFSELEKALDAGLYITKHSASGKGLLLLEEGVTKKFVQKLPIIYKKLEALELAERKVKQKHVLLEEVMQRQRRPDSEYYPKTTKKNLAWGFGEAGTEIIVGLTLKWGIAAGILDAANWNPPSAILLAFGILVTPLFILLSGGTFPGYARTTGAELAWLIDNNSSAREKIRSTKLSLAKRKKEKLESKLEKSVKKVLHSSLPYTRKWLKQEKKEILKMLGERKQDFVSSYLEFESNLAPSDALKLKKTFEAEINKNIEKLKEEDPKQILNFYDKATLAKAAGIWTGDLKRKLESVAKGALAREEEAIKKHEETKKRLVNFKENV